jgi:hypothetical protein
MNRDKCGSSYPGRRKALSATLPWKRQAEAAVKYAKTYWSYEPPDGQKMPAEMLFTVTFVLR